MAFHQILSTAELQIAPDGLYYVAGDDGASIEEIRDYYNPCIDEHQKQIPMRLMARVREAIQDIKPTGIEGITVRSDGKEIVKAWVPVSTIEPKSIEEISRETGIPIAAELPQPNVEAVRCPICGTQLANRVIHAVTVCPGCGSSIALVDGSAIKATSTHTLSLTPEEIKLLKSDRPKVRA